MSKYLLTEYYELCPNGLCEDLLTEAEKQMVKEGSMYRKVFKRGALAAFAISDMKASAKITQSEAQEEALDAEADAMGEAGDQAEDAVDAAN